MHRLLIFAFIFLGGFQNELHSENLPELVENHSPKYIVNEKGERIYLNPDKMPEYPGGGKALMEFISKNLRYPNTDACIQGRVIVEFIIKKEGDLSDFKILKSLDPSFDKEALRVLQLTPRWYPAIEHGSLVNARYVVPVTFKLESDIPNELSESKQNKTDALPKDEETKTICPVEPTPLFPGGEKAMMEYVAMNLRYPPQAVKDSIQGRVIATFVVSVSGDIRDVKVLKSLSPECDLEAVRMIRCMPKWIPGTQNGRPVSIYYTLPIHFSLSSKPIKNSR